MAVLTDGESGCPRGLRAPALNQALALGITSRAGMSPLPRFVPASTASCPLSFPAFQEGNTSRKAVLRLVLIPISCKAAIPPL